MHYAHSSICPALQPSPLRPNLRAHRFACVQAASQAASPVAFGGWELQCVYRWFYDCVLDVIRPALVLALSLCLQAATRPPADSFVEVGSIGIAHGIKGEVKVYISTDDPQARFGVPGKK